MSASVSPCRVRNDNPIAAPQFTVNVGAFIPGNYIQAPPVQGWCTGLGGRFPHIHVLPPQRLYFAGDNRSSFDPNGSFRARQLVTVVPDESASESGLAAGTMPKNEVGESKEYAQDALDNNGQLDSSDDDGVLGDCHLLDDEGTASNKDMHVAVSRLGPKKVSVHLYGSASNPSSRRLRSGASAAERTAQAAGGVFQRDEARPARLEARS